MYVRDEKSTSHRNFVFLSKEDAHKGSKSRPRRQANRHVQLRTSRGAEVERARPIPYFRKFRIYQRPQEEADSAARIHQSSGGLVVHVASPPIDRLLGGDLGSQGDRNALQYFVEVVAQDFSEEITDYFWQVYIPQQSHQEAMIRHALVALSHVHRWRNNSVPEYQFGAASPAAIPWKVVAQLRSYMQSPHYAYSTVISCAIILAAIQEQLGDLRSAALHMDNSMAIFNSWSQKLGASSPDYEVLRMRLVRHDTGATARNLARPLGLPALRVDTARCSPRVLSFDSAEQLDDHMTHYIGHPLFRCMAKMEMHDDTINSCHTVDLLAIGEELLNWAQAADRLKNSAPITPSNELAFLLVDAHYLASKCSLAEMMQRHFASLTMTGDYHAEAFLDLGHRATRIMEDQRRMRRWKDWSRNLTERGRGMTEILLLFASKTSSDDCRAQAVRLAEEYAAL